MFWLELVVVLLAIFMGARLGGIALGAMGGAGLFVLTFIFHLEPASPPIDVILIIAAVITAAGAMQTAGGLDYLVGVAEKILRKNPSRITYLGPIVTWVFTFLAGTGHVAYSVMPVIAEVSREAGVRPERPMSISAIASQQAITCSPVSAATAAMIGILASPSIVAAGYNLGLVEIMAICIPATFLGCMIAAFVMNHVGKELKDDPDYLKRVADGDIPPMTAVKTERVYEPFAKRSVVIFLLGAVGVVSVGLLRKYIPQVLPPNMSTPQAIEIVMLTIAGMIIIFCKVNVNKIMGGNVFQAGMMAVVGIFGIAWLGDTFFNAHKAFLTSGLSEIVQNAPWVFAIALFFLSVLLYSQAATTRALMPLGVTLGIPAPFLIAMFPSVNGYFFIPNYPTIVAAIGFDRTGTTKIGKFVLNHSFMLPGIVATVSAVTIGFGIAMIFLK